MLFADKLQSLRKSKGLSQEELAEKCNVTRQSVSKWETGLGYPETEKLLILCEILDVDLDYLLREKIMKLPAIPDREAVKDICSYLVGRKCDVRLKQDNLFLGLGFKKPGGFYSATIESISNDEIIVHDSNKCKQAARLSDILYIKEC